MPMKTPFFRTYLDGKLIKSSKPSDTIRGRKWLDNLQEMWAKNISPLVADGEFDPNNGHEVIRVSDNELLVTTTGNHKLRFLLVE